jgi:hypothetical protein
LILAHALPTNLTVTYVLRGSAKNGLDYRRLPGVRKIKAGKTKATIKVVPLDDLGGASDKIVTLILKDPDKDYTIEAKADQAQVKIVAGPQG